MYADRKSEIQFEFLPQIQFDVVFNSESWWYFRLSSVIWWWNMAILKFEICATPTAYANFFENFCLNKWSKTFYGH